MRGRAASSMLQPDIRGLDTAEKLIRRELPKIYLREFVHVD
jgi:hypothetical protein